MMIIAVDYRPSFQAIAFFMEETGECGEQELNHSDGQAEKFYRDLQQRGIRVRVGMEVPSKGDTKLRQFRQAPAMQDFPKLRFIYPYDEGVFLYSRRESVFPKVSNIQAYLDLYALGGRESHCQTHRRS
jgi:hypothetical protein